MALNGFGAPPDRLGMAPNGSGASPDAFRMARNAGEESAGREEKAGGVRQHAPGMTGYFTGSGAGEAGAAVSGAGGFGAECRELPRNGRIPNSTSFSLSFP